MAAELLDRVADGRTDLAWEHLARGGPARATGAHRIHPDRKPMAVSLRGRPRGAGTPEGGAR